MQSARLNTLALSIIASFTSLCATAGPIWPRTQLQKAIEINGYTPTGISGWACFNDADPAAHNKTGLSNEALILRLKAGPLNGTLKDAVAIDQTTTGLYRPEIMTAAETRCSRQNPFSGFRFTQFPTNYADTPQKYYVVEVDRRTGIETELSGTSSTSGFQFPNSAADAINNWDGWVDDFSITSRTQDNVNLNVNGWACNKLGGAPTYLHILDGEKNRILDIEFTPTPRSPQPGISVNLTSRPDVPCQAVAGGKMYGFNINMSLNSASYKKLYDGMWKDLHFYMSSVADLNRPETSHWRPLKVKNTPQVYFGRNNKTALKMGHLVAPRYDNMATFNEDLTQMFGSLDGRQTGTLQNGTNLNLLMASSIVNGVAAGTPGYPAKLAEFHSEYLKYARKHGFKAAVIVGPLLFRNASFTTREGSVETSPVPRPRDEWRNNWFEYTGKLLALTEGLDRDVLEYFYPVDEIFWSSHTQYFFGHPARPAAQWEKEKETIDGQIVELITELRGMVGDKKLFTSIAGTNYTSHDPLSDKQWEMIAGNFDLVTTGAYPITNQVEGFNPIDCVGTTTGEFITNENIPNKIGKCYIDKMRTKLEDARNRLIQAGNANVRDTKILALTQGYLPCTSGSNPEACFADPRNVKNIKLSPYAVEEDIRRMARFNTQMYKYVNQDASGKLVGLANFVYQVAKPNPDMTDASRMLSTREIDLFLEKAGINANSTQRPTDFFNAMGQCAKDGNKAGYMDWSGKFSCHNTSSMMKRR
ncbi:hypothetical protein ACUHMQ_17300 [Chitinimonas sp. PSY-7]|uniref:hypothetical protein n=1 Tax=Chitinimonas sp. PSY-7 TaxID=3459088 RepID=UPI0040402358